MNLTHLFHWAPADRYESISRHGLLTLQEPTVASARLHYACASLSPDRAWMISGALNWCAGIDNWDLWMIHIGPLDQLHLRPQFGPLVEEVMIHNPIPSDRLWWVGRRSTTGTPGEMLEIA